MIEIKKCDNLSGLEDFGFDLYPTSVIMSAKEKDEILGAGEIIVFEGYAVLGKIYVKPQYEGMNFDLAIAKSLLNMADLGEIKYIFSNALDEALAKRLRFCDASTAENEELSAVCDKYKYFLNLEGYFTSHC